VALNVRAEDQTGKGHRIGYLGGASATFSTRFAEAFRHRLRETRAGSAVDAVPPSLQYAQTYPLAANARALHGSTTFGTIESESVSD